MALFPEVNIDESETSQTENPGKSFLFDFSKCEFVLEDGKLVEVLDTEAVKVWIQKTLRTEKNRYRVYEDIDYGVVIEDLIISSTFPKQIILSELKREIQEGLTKHSMIDSVSDFQFSKDKDLLTVTFTVNLADDSTITEEVTI